MTDDLPKPDGLKLNDEQVKAMMEWQLHAAYWVTSQAVILTKVANDEGLELGDDDVLRTALEMFRLAREEDKEQREMAGMMVNPATGEPMQ